MNTHSSPFVYYPVCNVAMYDEKLSNPKTDTLYVRKILTEPLARSLLAKYVQKTTNKSNNIPQNEKARKDFRFFLTV